MATSASIRPPGPRDRAVAGVLRRWRELTGGRAVRDAERRTLLACSGGADSSALVLAFASRRRDVVVAHVVHDLRAEREAHADRDAARELAEAMGMAFVETNIVVRDRCAADMHGDRNLEARARRGRYAALARLAEREGCGYVATAHHADDQLETVLMRLMRGAGPVGLSGVRAARALNGRVTLIRPMLGMTRDGARSLCERSGWVWREDATNADVSRLRSAIRHGVTPKLRELSPRAAERAGVTAEILADASEHAIRRTRQLLREASVDLAGNAASAAESGVTGVTVARSALRDESAMVLAALLQQCGMRIGVTGRPATWCGRQVVRAAGAIRGEVARRTSHRVGGLRVEVSAREVRVTAWNDGRAADGKDAG